MRRTTLVRNVSDEPVAVTPTLYWMEGSAARSAQGTSFRLLPGETTMLDVRSLLVRAGLESFNGSVNLTLSVLGRAHSVLLASGSVDAKNTYVFQVLPRAVLESAAKTVSYWDTANGDDTMITVWNPADEAQDYALTLSFSGGHYVVPIHLEARATLVLNVSELIQNQTPDHDGNIIPAGILEGSAKISGIHAENESILVAVDSGTYNVRKATCTYYCISCDGEVLTYLVVSPFAVAKGGTDQLNFEAKWNTGSVYYLNNNTSSWTSSNTSIGTVGSGLVKGVSPGGLTISAFSPTSVYNSYYCAYDPYCPYTSNVSGSGPGNVIPTISITGNLGYLYIGHDSQVTTHINALYTSTNPTGGTYKWSSPNTGVSFDSTSASNVHITATTYSGGTNDTQITVNYTYNNESAVPASVWLTKRLFYCLANDSVFEYQAYNGPTYGYTYNANYTVYTHPDHAAVTDGNGVGTTENVTQTSTSDSNVVPNYGQGALNNNQVQDSLGLVSSTPLPTTLKIVDSQDIGVGGFFVRSNTLTYTATGVTVQSGGPSN